MLSARTCISAAIAATSLMTEDGVSNPEPSVDVVILTTYPLVGAVANTTVEPNTSHCSAVISWSKAS